MKISQRKVLNQELLNHTKIKTVIDTNITSYSKVNKNEVLRHIIECAREQYVAIGKKISAVEEFNKKNPLADFDEKINRSVIQKIASSDLSGLTNGQIAIILYYLISNGANKSFDDYFEIGRRIASISANFIKHPPSS